MTGLDARTGRPPESASPRFATTQWSVVLAAGGECRPNARRALAALCEIYWYPLYAYVRRQGYAADEAQDLTQEFFTRLIESHSVQRADPERGKFRSFLLGSLKHFLANEWRRAHTQKRRGDQAPLSLDLVQGENRYNREPAHDLTPDKLFEKRWALTLLDQALAQLRDVYAAQGKLDLFDSLRPYLSVDPATAPYAQVAETLGMTEGAVKVAVHRLRRRCGEALRSEIAQTVATAEEIDDELRDVIRAVSE